MILLLSVLGIIAVAVAFDKAVEKEEMKTEKVFNEAWFSYNSIGPQNLASSYTYMESPAECEGEAVLCAIKIESPSQNPEDGLHQDDLDALLTQENPSNPTVFPEESDNVSFRD